MSYSNTLISNLYLPRTYPCVLLQTKSLALLHLYLLYMSKWNQPSVLVWLKNEKNVVLVLFPNSRYFLYVQIFQYSKLLTATLKSSQFLIK